MTATRTPRKSDKPIAEPEQADERYYVFEVSGFSISPSAIGGAQPRKQPKAFYIYDREHCHRIVAVYPKGRWNASGPKLDSSRANAVAHCAKLNAAEQEERAA